MWGWGGGHCCSAGRRYTRCNARRSVRGAARDAARAARGTRRSTRGTRCAFACGAAPPRAATRRVATPPLPPRRVACACARRGPCAASTLGPCGLRPLRPLRPPRAACPSPPPPYRRGRTKVLEPLCVYAGMRRCRKRKACLIIVLKYHEDVLRYHSRCRKERTSEVRMVNSDEFEFISPPRCCLDPSQGIEGVAFREQCRKENAPSLTTLLHTPSRSSS